MTVRGPGWSEGSLWRITALVITLLPGVPISPANPGLPPAPQPEGRWGRSCSVSCHVPVVFSSYSFPSWKSLFFFLKLLTYVLSGSGELIRHFWGFPTQHVALSVLRLTLEVTHPLRIEGNIETGLCCIPQVWQASVTVRSKLYFSLSCFPLQKHYFLRIGLPKPWLNSVFTTEWVCGASHWSSCVSPGHPVLCDVPFGKISSVTCHMCPSTWPVAPTALQGQRCGISSVVRLRSDPLLELLCLGLNSVWVLLGVTSTFQAHPVPCTWPDLFVLAGVSAVCFILWGGTSTHATA